MACGLVSSSIGADSTTVSLAEKEIQRRSQFLGEQVKKLEAADTHLIQGDSAAAYAQYGEVFQSMPDIPTARSLRVVALEGYLRSGLIRARQLASQGDYKAANSILDQLDRPGVAQGDRDIAELRSKISDPDRYPPALTPDHVKNVAEVQRLLTLAASQHETGMYDKALATFEEVLRLDATNTAARRGMERVEQERARYFSTARDHQRSRMLNGVTELWENKPRMEQSTASALNAEAAVSMSAANGATGKAGIARKLQDIRISKVDFSGATLEEVIEYLRVRSRDLDPDKKGIDFVLGLPADSPLQPVSLSLIDVPVEEVLRYATEVSGVSYRVEEFAVRIVALTDTSTTLISRTFRVPPGFISNAAIADAPAAATADPFATNAAATGTGIQRRMGAKEFLESRGITFPDGAGANYNPIANMLIVRNTAKNIELVESLVEQSLNSSPKMAVIEVKIMEINSTKLDEMGFDWLLGGFGANADNIFIGGGTAGNQQAAAFATNEFPAAAGLNRAAMGPMTAGLRSSVDLVANRSIDDVLFGALQDTARRPPGAFSVAGVFTDPQFQVVWRGLNQKSGVDLVSKPSVVTKSGQKASVEIVREMIYPTEFDPPQIPTNVGGGGGGGGAGVGNTTPTSIPVTPTTPTAFEMRRVGMVLDVEPVIAEDSRSVELTLTPELTEFVGFVNYGSPIYSVTPASFIGGVLQASSRVELTPNTILQPIFSTRKVVTGVKVYDGATVVLGGVIADNNIMIDDQIPVLGNLPLLGRAFQSKVSQRRTKNMIMFVTVKVIDPSGNRVNQN